MLSQINKDMSDVEQNYKSYYSITRLKNALTKSTDDSDDEFLFIVDVSDNYSVNYINSNNSDDMDLMQSLTNICMGIDSDKAIVKFEDRFYFFSKLHFQDFATRIIVLDVSDKMFVLHQLLLNLILIGTIALVLIFLMSNFFTNKSMKPIEVAFVKQKYFISDASHELKTPLAVVKTNLDVLNKSVELSEDDKKWLRYATEEVNQMSKMVNEFLYLAKMESAGKIANEAIIDFSSIINGVILTMEAIAFEKHIMINENIKDDVFIRGSQDGIKRLIVILVDNAIKYCNENGRIDISLETNGTNGQFIIKNTGTVIDSKDKDVIFEKFYRANKERERQSHSYGIGLSIAKSTCENHGFTIKAYPENDKTCFKIAFKAILNNDKAKS